MDRWMDERKSSAGARRIMWHEPDGGGGDDNSKNGNSCQHATQTYRHTEELCVCIYISIDYTPIRLGLLPRCLSLPHVEIFIKVVDKSAITLLVDVILFKLCTAIAMDAATAASDGSSKGISRMSSTAESTADDELVSSSRDCAAEDEDEDDSGSSWLLLLALVRCCD